MKVLTLTSTLLTAFSLTALGQSSPVLESKISSKEKQLAELTRELASLRSGKSTRTAPSNTSTYTVKPGDTLYSIARNLKCSAGDIMKWNNITDPTRVGVGEKLIVSAAAAPAPTTAKKTVTATTTSKPKATGAYRVEKGDTFYSIARRHQMSVKELRSLNPAVSTDLIAPGQSIAISGSTAVAKAQPKTAPKPATSAKAPVRESITIANTPKKVSKPAPKSTPKAAPKAAPKTLSTAITLASKPADPAPKKEAVAVEAPKKNSPIATPPTPPVVSEPGPSAPVAAIILTEVMTFEAFATKHGTSTDQLNALNGWNMNKATVLARGSEIYVPK